MGNHNIKNVIKHGTVENLKELLSKTETPNQLLNQQFRYGWNAPHLAIHFHKLDILQYLCSETEADLNHVDNDHSTLLHHAVYFADTHFDFVKYLLESEKFKFDERADIHGNTSLHLVFKICSIKQIEDLMPYFKGCKEVFSTPNNHKQTPLDMLKERVKGQEESLKIVDELQKEIEKGQEAHEEEEREKKPPKKGSSILGRMLHHEKHEHEDGKEGEEASSENGADGETSGSGRTKTPIRKSGSMVGRLFHHGHKHDHDDDKESHHESAPTTPSGIRDSKGGIRDSKSGSKGHHHHKKGDHADGDKKHKKSSSGGSGSHADDEIDHSDSRHSEESASDATPTTGTRSSKGGHHHHKKDKGDHDKEHKKHNADDDKEHHHHKKEKGEHKKSSSGGSSSHADDDKEPKPSEE